MENQRQGTIDELMDLRTNSGTKNDIDKCVEKLKRLNLKLKGQRIYAQSLDINSFPMVDKLQGILQLIQDFELELPQGVLDKSELIKIISSLITALYNINNDKTCLTISINLTNLLVQHLPYEKVRAFMNILCAASGVMYEKFQTIVTQSDGDVEIEEDLVMSKKIWDFLTGAVDTVNDMRIQQLEEFCIKVSALFYSVRSYCDFDKLDMKTALVKFRELKKLSVDSTSVVDGLVSAYTFVIAHWEQITSGDWSCLMLGKNTAVNFEKEVQQLKQQYVLVASGRLEELKELYSRDEKEYLIALKKCIKQCDLLTKQAVSTNQRIMLQRYVTDLRDLETNIYLMRAGSPDRKQPYGLLLSGPSKTGKSTLVNQLCSIILDEYGHDYENGMVTTANIDERFESTVEPFHKVIVCDDVANNANSKPNFDRILNYVNTVPRSLEKAGVEEKGKKFPMNDACIVTTNVPHLNAIKHSNCPESILRRFGLHINVRISEKFRNHSGGIIDMDETRFDVYELELRRFSHIDPTCDEKHQVIYDVIPHIEWNPTGKHENDIAFLLQYLRKDLRTHITQQIKRAAVQKELRTGELCDECKNPTVVCACACTMDEEEDIIAENAADVMAYATEKLWDIRDVTSSYGIKAMGNMTTCLMTLQFWMYLFSRKNYIKRAVWSSFIFYVLMGIKTIQTGNYLYALLAFYGIPVCYILMMWSMKRELDIIIATRKDALSSISLSTRDYCSRHAKHAMATVATVYFLYKLYKIVCPTKQDTSTYLPAVTDIFTDDVVIPKNKYYNPSIDGEFEDEFSRLPPRLIGPSATTTSDDLQGMLARSIRLVTLKTKGKQVHNIQGFLVKGNILLVPAHVLPETRPFDVETTPSPGNPSSVTKDQNLGNDHIAIIGNKDLACIHLPSAPAAKDYTPFFPEKEVSFESRPTVLIGKTNGNVTYSSKQAIRPYYSFLGKKELTYYGSIEKDGIIFGTKNVNKYITIKNPYTGTLEFGTYQGMCGSVYVDREKAIIYGMHVAGRAGKSQAFLTTINRHDINQAIEQLDKTSPQMILSPKTDLRLNTQGTNYSVVAGTPLFMHEGGTQDGSIVTYYGKVLRDGEPMVESARSPYMKTPFVGIQEEFGVANSIPPKFPNSIEKGLKTLNKLTSPVQHYEHDTLALAIKDYTEQVLQLVRENKDEAQTLIRLYTQQEALDGVGAAGFKGMPNSTSAGHPYNCSKRKVLLSDPLDPSKPIVPRELDDTNFEIQKDIDEIYSLWTNGFRSDTIFKASSKTNELLPRAKANTKVRKFYGSNMAFLVNSRRILSGLVLMMRNHPDEFECAVGINPKSYHWTKFHKRMTTFGGQRMIAGDFSGFDTTMAQQVSTAAAQVIVSIYREAGVPEEHITILKACLSDICNPNVLFMGDLYNFANMNPSGQPITVQLNSIVNSIMMRYVYFKIYPDAITPFSTHIKLSTFGDDNLMDVARTAPKFTHTNCQIEFAKVGVGYTMAEKDSESKPYITIDEASFLKRGFKKLEHIDGMGAPIEKESIVKKYHYCKKPGQSPLSAAEQFAAYCDGAFEDAYMYGMKYYNDFQQSIQRIISANPELQGRIALLTYNEMTNKLKPYYSVDYKGGDSQLYFEEDNSYFVEDL